MTSYWLRYRGVRFPLRLGETVLGRSPYCAVTILDPEVSRTHAVIRLTRDGPEIQDLNSANGTTVNGARTQEPKLLSEGDLIRIGNAQLEIVTTGPIGLEETERSDEEAQLTARVSP